jgi:NADH-quinone oxidoreductase subunit A
LEATTSLGYKPTDSGCEGAMNAFLLQYLPILVFLAVALVLGLAFVVGAWLLAPKHPDPEKISAYECGFNSFDDARMKFDIRFYLVAILFIVFDLEVAFLFPWAVSLMHQPHGAAQAAFVSMLTFLVDLALGYVYVWKKGALEWE